MATDSPKMRVKALYVYPIKSLRGLTPPSLTATYRGFAHDRHFCLQDVAKNTHMTVSNYTEMCLFSQHPATDSTSASTSTCSSDRDNSDSESNNDDVSSDNVNAANFFEVHYSLLHAFTNPLHPIPPSSHKFPNSILLVPYSPSFSGLVERQVIMESSPTVGYDMGSKYNAWFSERLGYEVRLLYIGGNGRKVLGNMPPRIAGVQRREGTRGEGLENLADGVDGNGDGRGNSRKGGAGGWFGSLAGAVRSVLGSVVGRGTEEEFDGVDRGIAFSDMAPYMVVSTKSWENVNKRLPEGEEYDISKFRPNIVVEGADEAFEEDFWAELQIGEGKIVLTQNCSRCTSLNVDYSTGKVGEGESGKILKKLQKDRRVDLGTKYSPVFGRYGFLARTKVAEDKGCVELRVGDDVTVVKRNDKRTRFEWPGESTDK